MPDKSLASYIQQQLNNGFDINSIRNHLIKYGHSIKQVDDAIDNIYRNKEVKHTLHLSKSSALVLIFIFMGISMVIASIFIYLSPLEKKEYLLDLETDPLTTSVEPGQLVEFTIQLFNIGYKEKFDVHLTHTITNTETGRIITSFEEEVGVITRVSKTSRIRLPLKTELGNYKLETIASYQQKTASTAFVFTVFKEGIETCFDNIQNQAEEKVDCGGPCTPCEEDEEEDDSEEDSDEEEQEDEEEEGSDEEDDEEDEEESDEEEEPEKNLKETMEEILEIAQTDQQKAIDLCKKFEEDIGKDYCFNNIAQSTENDSLCNNITDTLKKDSCIMNIAIETNNYSNCNLISNTNLKNSCNLLAG